MDYFLVATIIIFLCAIFGYFNERFLKLPITIGLTLMGILFTLGTYLLSYFNPELLNFQRVLISQIDFKDLLLNSMLSFLLFAGALNVDYKALKEQFAAIASFATLGVLLSTFLVGTFSYYLFPVVGVEIPFIHCLLFGAIISPTDPIAVLGILKKVGIAKDMEIRIVGESLFNDGVGVIVFTTILLVEQMGIGSIGGREIFGLFIEEVGGGLLLGLGLGYISYYMMKRIENYQVEIVIMMAVVMTGTVLARYLHVSAPLAMVAAGIMLGQSNMKSEYMDKEHAIFVEGFWELADMLLNTILFVLIGMEMVVLTLKASYFYAGLISIPIVLLCRYLSILPSISLNRKKIKFEKNSEIIMTWAGLRGGISIALALSLDKSVNQDLILFTTYIVVVFSILVQGLTLGKVIQKLMPNSCGTEIQPH